MDVRLITTRAPAAAAAEAICRRTMRNVAAACDRFDPTSELRNVSSGAPTVVSATLACLLGRALHAARITNGAVDPTLGFDLIRQGYDAMVAHASAATPTSAPARRRPRWGDIELVDRTLTVPPGVLLDLGATAKPTTADAIASHVVAALGGGVLVSLGGDLRSAGLGPRGGWPVLVQDGAGEPADMLRLPSGSALATSSTLHRTWQHQGRPSHHILDPGTGRPAPRFWRTVSVIAADCLTANAWSTAAIVLGADAPTALRSTGHPTRLVDVNGQVTRLNGWSAFVQSAHTAG